MDDSAVSFGTNGWRAQGDAFTTKPVCAVGRALVTCLGDNSMPGGVAVGDGRERVQTSLTTGENRSSEARRPLSARCLSRGVPGTGRT